MTGFIWSKQTRSRDRRLTKFEKIQGRLIQAAKDSDIDEVREFLKGIKCSSNEGSTNQTSKEKCMVVSLCDYFLDTYHSYSVFYINK